MSRLTILSPSTAPEASQERLAAAAKANGFLPNLLGVLAHAPTALETYQTVGAINGRTSLSPLEREIIQLTAAKRNACDFCVAGHSKLSLLALQLDPEVIAKVKSQTSLDDPKLNALVAFTLAVINERGQVSDNQLDAFFAAGYQEQQALEVVLGVSLATLCNYANNLAQTPINPELAAYL